MDVELRERDASKAHQAPLDKSEKPSFEVQDSNLEQNHERMGLLDDAEKALSTTDVESFSLSDIFQVSLAAASLLDFQAPTHVARKEPDMLA